MDPLDGLLEELAREPLPAESLARIRPRVESAIKRRRAAWGFAAMAASLALVLWMQRPVSAPIPLPEPVQALIAVPDLVLSPTPAPQPVSRRRFKVIDENTVQLATTNPDIVIYWSL
jgi:hypothetical protein